MHFHVHIQRLALVLKALYSTRQMGAMVTSSRAKITYTPWGAIAFIHKIGMYTYRC